MQYTVDDKLGALSLISQRKLTDILDKIPGGKDFIIDTSLIKPLERIIGVSKLRCHGVDKIYKLEKTAIPCTNAQRVFFIISDIITLKHVCDKINSELSSSSGNSYHIIFVNRTLGSLSQLLEEEGIHGCVSTYSFQWELIQIDTRILSLEHHMFYKKLFVDGDQSFLPCVAKSIWSLQLLLGKPLVTFVQGKYSHLVHNMVNMFYDEVSEVENPDSHVSCFVIVDRDIDYVSTLLTSGTYTSLLDEVFGIKSGVVDIKTSSSDNSSVCHLSSSDEVYSQIKNRHFSDVYSFLGSKTKELSEEFKRSQNMALQEMKVYIAQKLQSVTALKKSLSYHIGACEAIINQIGHKFEALQTTERNILEGRYKRESFTYIEESLAVESSNRCGILRLMCLLSLTQDGLFPDEIFNLKNQFLHMYGYENLPCFNNLQKIGLFTEQASLITKDMKGGNLVNKVVQTVSLPTRRSIFSTTAVKLKLFPEATDSYELKNPKDMGYVFSGSYIPLVCQLVSYIIKQETPLEEISKLISNCSVYSNLKSNRPMRSFVVYFIGGVTYAEISAFQLLEKLTGSQIIVAGTTITNGNQIMQACL